MNERPSDPLIQLPALAASSLRAILRALEESPDRDEYLVAAARQAWQRALREAQA